MNFYVWVASNFLFCSALHCTAFHVSFSYECLNHGLKCQGDCRDTIYAKATLLVQETVSAAGVHGQPVILLCFYVLLC